MENHMEIPQKIKIINYHMTEQFHFWVFIWKKKRKLQFENVYVPLCLLQHYLQ